jgi:hypothetical protein
LLGCGTMPFGLKGRGVTAQGTALGKHGQSSFMLFFVFFFGALKGRNGG